MVASTRRIPSPKQQPRRGGARGCRDLLAVAGPAHGCCSRACCSPVNHLAAAAQRVGAGDFTANFELPGRDELAVLSMALTQMTSQLRAHAEEVRGSRSALEASHERFAAVAKATNDIIWDWDPRTDRVWRNDAVKTVLGYEAVETAQGLSWLRNVASARSRACRSKLPNCARLWLGDLVERVSAAPRRRHSGVHLRPRHHRP